MYFTSLASLIPLLLSEASRSNIAARRAAFNLNPRSCGGSPAIPVWISMMMMTTTTMTTTTTMVMTKILMNE
jgi:hypothetical protein